MHSTLISKGTFALLLLLFFSLAQYQAAFTPLNRTLSGFLGYGDAAQPRIIGGNPISIDQAKYQVSLRLKAREKQGFGNGFICGGSVITQRVVLTAAHCIYDNSQTPAKRRADNEFTCVMGSEFLYLGTQQTLQYDAQKIVVHGQYNLNTLENDIAMILINGYIPWQWSTVQAIALATKPIPDETLCSVSGWGVMANGKVSSVLNMAQVPIINWTRCSISYTLSKGMLCAGYYREGGVDACQGDSGGPLACNGQLAGIVSWGAGCAERFLPGVYTNVSYYQNWILATNSSFNYTQYGGGAAQLFEQSHQYVLLTCVISWLVSQMLRS